MQWTPATRTWVISRTCRPRFSPSMVTRVPPSLGPASGHICMRAWTCQDRRVKNARPPHTRAHGCAEMGNHKHTESLIHPSSREAQEPDVPWLCGGGCSARCDGSGASSFARGCGSAAARGTSCQQGTSRNQRRCLPSDTGHSSPAEPRICTAGLGGAGGRGAEESVTHAGRLLSQERDFSGPGLPTLRHSSCPLTKSDGAAQLR